MMSAEREPARVGSGRHLRVVKVVADQASVGVACDAGGVVVLQRALVAKFRQDRHRPGDRDAYRAVELARSKRGGGLVARALPARKRDVVVAADGSLLSGEGSADDRATDDCARTAAVTKPA